MARAKQAVGKRDLVRVDGMPEVLENLKKRMERATAEAIKATLIDGGKPIWRQARANIQGLPVSARLKQILTAEVAMMKGKPKQPSIVVGISQAAGISRLGNQASSRGGKSFIINPYWVEKGIAGHRTGPYTGHPFFRPAVDSTKSEVVSRLSNGFKKLLVDAE